MNLRFRNLLLSLHCPKKEAKKFSKPPFLDVDVFADLLRQAAELALPLATSSSLQLQKFQMANQPKRKTSSKKQPSFHCNLKRNGYFTELHREEKLKGSQRKGLNRD